jgi:plastocyanin
VEREAVIRGYVEGQLSRRVFLRHLVTAGVTMGAALVYADVLAGVPAEAVTADFYIRVTDFVFDPSNARVAVGQTVTFGMASGNSVSHAAIDASAAQTFGTGWVAPNDTFTIAPPGSGAFPYVCPDEAHAEMSGTLRIPPSLSTASATVGQSVTVRWAPAAQDGYTWDVQIERPGTGEWRTWRDATTAAKRAFTPNATGRYRFRARTRSGTGTSGWSPGVRLTVS